ncbi:MAG TPA: HAMP domain-containing sensor histidine kinase [Xanthomonadales bacterium]|nr:HAMP domain-containing sensor histidine kinase [Xanthomonadales bacterium]
MLFGLFDKIDDKRRLRWLLSLLFLALLIPTAAVLWQAYGQIQWESFHQHRSQAENLTRQINADITDQLYAAENRSFAEYSFLNVSGDPDAGFLQLSPLSNFPVVQTFPGVIGFFQINADGSFSTPLLPGVGTSTELLGIDSDEYRERQQLAERIRTTLAGNNLIVDRVGAAGIEAPGSFDELKEGARGKQKRDEDELRQLNAPVPEEVAEQVIDPTTRENQIGALAEAEPESEKAKVQGNVQDSRKDQYARVRDLQFDDSLQKKSESADEEADLMEMSQASPSVSIDAPARARRTEQSILPETVAQAGFAADAAEPVNEIRITTFESEVDPFEFALLDSGEFVLFRKVWRESERLVQGMLIDQAEFVEGMITSPYQGSDISYTTDLVVTFGEYVIRTQAAGQGSEYFSTAADMRGDLLYRSRLASPMDSMELIFSVGSLPAGPGATVLGWTSILLLAVFGGGFLALYRLGLGQIRLARQQQDFVSSVSHELKTPLTSIRMYSEMLKEGWADEARRQQYYEFIHDESERLSRLISNVLQLSSITRNRPNFDIRPYTLAELLDQIQSKISSQVESADFELITEENEQQQSVVVEIDQDCLMQIVINLVDNAIKFSRQADVRRIVIAANVSSDGLVRFSVRDHGPGIPREQMKKVFRLFYRPESELTRETVGTGIGLAIVHQLTVSMGGKVDVVNRKPGAEFGVSFPAVQDRG